MDKGAQSGETFFFEYLKPTQDLAQARMKYNRLYLQELREDFDPKLHITGESSVQMGPSCTTPSMVQKMCGKQVKIIYLLREPVSRMISQYEMRKRLDTLRPTDKDSFVQTARDQLAAFRAHRSYGALMEWLKQPDLVNGAEFPPCMFPKDQLNPNPLWAGLYVVHLSRWVRQFPSPSSLLIVQSERFFADPESTYLSALTFLGLNTSMVNAKNITSEAFNQASPSPVAGTKNEKKEEDEELKEVKKELAEFFKPFNDRLFRWLKELHLDHDIKPWK